MLLQPGARVHMIAICGTAMASLAGMLRERGFRVTGSDARVYPPMSTLLAELGIPLAEGYAAGNLGDCDLVIVGNAVSRGNPELEATLNRRIPYLSLPEVLRELFLRDRTPVVITGTHGKTTTTALAAYLLERGGLRPSFLIAGAPRNWDRPYRLAGGEHFVIEGDEYDSAYYLKIAKFFFYLPHVLVINNIEFDHADIYRDLAEIQRAFRLLINTVPENGLILANGDDPAVRSLLGGAPAPVQTFGLGDTHHDLRAIDLQPGPEGTSFTLEWRGASLGRLRLPLAGRHNVRNGLAALGVGLWAGLEPDVLQAALGDFRGVRRRLELVGRARGVTVVDDFAHHPTAVRATLEALRQVHPRARLIALFEPASATNARAIFEAQYIDAFSAADLTLIGRVPRPERARSDAPFDPERLAAAMRAAGHSAAYLPAVDDMVERVAAMVQPGDVVVIMSNGAFGGIAALLLSRLGAQA